MDVYFKSIYSIEGKSEKGICQMTNINFEYNGNQCYIPAVYLFNEGIVIDIFEKIDNANAEQFVLKAIKYETIPITETQTRVMELNNPFDDFHVEKLSANGKSLKGCIADNVHIYSSCLQRKINVAEIMHGILKQLIIDWKNEYSFLDDNESYCVHRYLYNMENMNCQPIKNLRIITKELREFLAVNKCIKLPLGIQDKDTKINFVHPLNRDNVSIFINEVIVEDAERVNCKNMELPPYAIFVEFEMTGNIFEDRIIFELLNKDDNINKISGAYGFLIVNTSEKKLGLNGYPTRLENVGSLTYLPNEVEISVVGIDVRSGDKIEYEWSLV